MLITITTDRIPTSPRDWTMPVTIFKDNPLQIHLKLHRPCVREKKNLYNQKIHNHNNILKLHLNRPHVVSKQRCKSRNALIDLLNSAQAALRKIDCALENKRCARFVKHGKIGYTTNLLSKKLGARSTLNTCQTATWLQAERNMLRWLDDEFVDNKILVKLK